MVNCCGNDTDGNINNGRMGGNNGLTDRQRKVLRVSAIVVALLLGGVLAIIGTGGFSHFVEVARNALSIQTEVWVAVATGGGALLVGSVIGGLCCKKAAVQEEECYV